MAGVNGGLFALSAGGTIAKALTYSRWKGIHYVRTRVIPANPKTSKQIAIRSVFAELSQYWTDAALALRTPWSDAASGKPFTDRNLLVRENSALMNTNANLESFVASPGSPGVPPATVSALTPGVGTMAVANTPGTTPVGLTLTRIYSTIYKNQDPTNPLLTFPAVLENDSAGPTYSHTFTGLTSSAVYVVNTWYTYTDALLNVMYSRSSVAHATVS